VTWQRRAACRASPQLFDLDTDEPETPDERDTRHFVARAICSTCPVRTDCAIDAFSDPTTEGVRAGILFTEGRPA
jgi:hypothetical protein